MPNLLQNRRVLLANPPSGAAWSPLAFSPLVWSDSTQLGLSDGASVTDYTDLSGNGNTFTQSNGTKKFVYRANGINGKGAIESDGVDDAMTLAAFGAHTTWWAFLVARLLTAPSYGVLWGIDDYLPDTDYMLLEINSTSQLRVMNSAVGHTQLNLTIATDTDYAFIATGTGSVGNLYTSSISSATRAGNFSRADGAMRLGNRGDSQPINARFGELAFGSGTLTSDQRALLFAYANTKWGTAVP